MSVPSWARWALAAALVVAVATAGVAANLAVLGGETDDTRLGTLSARSIDPSGTPMPIPDVAGDREGTEQQAGDGDEQRGEREQEDGDDNRGDDRDDD